jgi:hypothetical protein
MYEVEGLCQSSSIYNNCKLAKVAIALQQGDATHLKHVQDASVDRIVCCPPFGRQFEKRSPHLYRDLLKEWSRVLADDGTMVLLIDMANAMELIKAVESSGCRVSFQRCPFRLGKIRATILIVNKTIRRTDLLVVQQPQTGLFEWESGDMEGRALWTFLRSQALPKMAPIRPNNLCANE